MDTSAPFNNYIDVLISVTPSILAALSAKNQYADIFFEDTLFQSIRGQHKPATSITSTQFEEKKSTLNGSGIHAFSQSEKEYGFVNGPPSKKKLIECADTLESYSASCGTLTLTKLPQLKKDSFTHNPISSVEKKQILRDILETAASLEPDLLFASLEFQSRVRRKCVITSRGEITTGKESTQGLRLHLKKKTKKEPIEVTSTQLAPTPYGILALDDLSAQIKSTIHLLNNLARAKSISSGSMPVIFEGAPSSLLPYSTGNAGIWLHEAIGHLLEADQYKLHPLAQMGARFTHIPLSISDAPLKLHVDSGLAYDDEGIPADATPLIVDGYLQQVLTDRYHSELLHVPHTGNGRRQDYRFAPLPRMTNLSLHPGSTSNESLVAGVKQGIYVKTIAHGQTHADNQRVQLVIKEGYRIQNGQITHPITNVTIEGHGKDMLNQIEGIGNDPPSEPHMVLCKKNQQVVPVYVSSPTVLIQGMHVYQHSQNRTPKAV